VRSSPSPSTPTPPAAPPRLIALSHPDFRRLWLGQLVSIMGSQMQLTAINWQVYDLLRGQERTVTLLGREVQLSAEALGLGGLGLANFIPIVLFALVGGMVADTKDRRSIMLATQSALALTAAALAALTWSGQASVGAIYLLSAATAASAAFNNPAQQSLIPNLVPRAHLTNAVSLNTVNWQVGTITGPALAGLLIGATGAGGVVAMSMGGGDSSAAGLGLVYALNALSFLAVIIALARMTYRGRPAPGTASGVGWKPLVEGLRFVRRTRLIWSTMLLDFVATVFSSARMMLPIVAGDILGVGPAGYGLLSAAQPVGSVIAGIAMSLKREIRRQGPVLLVSVAAYGLATVFFGLATSFWVAFFFFALTGAADTISTVIRATLRQMLTPDRLRGRMVGINMIFFMGGPQLGEVEAGLVAAFFGVPFAIASGGLATVAFTGWLAWRDPGLRRYDSGAVAFESVESDLVSVDGLDPPAAMAQDSSSVDPIPSTRPTRPA
jgi:MFS family permease